MPRRTHDDSLETKKNKRPRPLPKTASVVAEKGIDAASVGLNPDGTVKDGDIEEFE